MRYVWSVVGMVFGFLIMKYSIQITDTFGKVDWAERHLTGGLAGTITFYRLVGLLILIFSVLYIFGGLGFVLGPLGPLFGG